MASQQGSINKHDTLCMSTVLIACIVMSLVVGLSPALCWGILENRAAYGAQPSI